ncbi:uncharacterized protein LOC129761333 [Toxorhynchites rutilus septentrionalis]|uniref:uncharacterized protein LOC129761333 n=1 Tax=Toxorhynchites rutilus septentrionalis TaxID=329112 RepID=UPI0024793947|nr:uncharacterized protein LOC129761333 [Toxorhynchites rutilus septentrionalis]
MGCFRQEQLLRFWELESCQSHSTLSVEETLCEAHFAATTTRNDSGRFITQLPKRSTVLSKLGNSKEIAKRRFLALERRLNANPQLKKAYSDFIEEYYLQGHMEEIAESEDLDPEVPSYYMPHHCVVRPDSLTTKLRVVFDASCATDSGVSLNDGLMIGSPDTRLCRTLRRCTGKATYPEASKVISRDFYMDDLLTGIDDIQEGQQLCSQLLYLLQSAGFCLRKWSSNCPQVLEHFPADLRDERTVFNLDSSSAPIKTLGLKWQTTTDEFLFDVPKWNDTALITKRIALSDAAKLFDPLGLVGPVIVQAKIYLQDLWRSQKQWDEPLDNELQQRWLEFRKNLDALRNLSVPRWVVPVAKPVSIEMHGFCDASEKAYGACIYLRVLAEDGSVYVNLLTAKSKIAPLGDSRKQKRVCLPRLELSAALLLAHLYQKVQNAITIVTKAFFWSDSTIVLHWLSGTPSRWKTFIANRVSEIQHATAALHRLVAWVRRCTFNAKPTNRTHRRLELLNAAELEEACKCLVRIAQQEDFREEFTSLENTGEVKPTSKLNALTPFIEEGILRVGGRLRHARVSPARKHPMILPSKHPFSELVARYYHQEMLHAGPQLLIACLREKFWPLRARNLARRIVHSCINCFRCRPKHQQQIMGDLPTERVSPTLPFLRTGVDLCGPIYFRYPQRNSRPIKGYVAVFVCLSIKAVHIELVGDLSTASFLAALRRFIARRGKPRLIECDNARNFRGASREVAELVKKLIDQQLQNEVIRSCSDDGIDFKFIPPRSPNFGGLWEAAIKSFKTHLKSTLGNTILTAEQLTTLLAQIESCMNSRPLTQLSADPDDLEVLTPGHFLIHRPLAALAEPSYEELPFERLDRWQQPKTKWTRKKDNISIGTLVLVKDDGLPPLKWRYGRVTHIFLGDDGNIRVVVVKTKNGEYRRAISKICVLPIDQSTPPAANEAAGDL